MTSNPRVHGARTAGALLAAVIGLPAAHVHASDISRVTPFTPRASLEQAERSARLQQPDGAHFAIGDRLKITFFESIAPQSGEATALANLIERSELSGEHIVQEDGRIFLPLIGEIMAAGKGRGHLADELTTEINRALNGQIRVVIQTLSREPVYITGPVGKAGTVKHLPGMIVLHALALTGASDALSGDHWRRLDLARERERLRKSEERIKLLSLRAAVLVAERNGGAPRISPQLREMAGERAQNLLDEEEELRRLELDKRADESRALTALIASMRIEERILRERMAHTEKALKVTSDRAASLSALRSRGTVTDANLHLALSELSEARQRWHEVRGAIAQLERRILEVEQRKVALAIEGDLQREKELKQIVEQLGQEQITRAALRQVLMGFAEDVQLGAAGGAGVGHFRILRRSASGLKQIGADEMTALEPGDILQVGSDATHMTGSVPPSN